MSNREIEIWYDKHQKKMLDKGVYHDPCNDCSGEDCVCCEYKKGY